MTTSGLAKLKFDPSVYRVNAYQGLVYDPMRKCNKSPCACSGEVFSCMPWFV